MPGKHILIADDEDFVCASLSIILRRWGYSVTTVKDGRQALEKIIELKDGPHAVDVVLTDVQMDGLTGMELIVRLDELNIGIPVLVMTGHGFPSDIPNAALQNRVKFIDKPFSAVQLLDTISNSLRNGS